MGRIAAASRSVVVLLAVVVVGLGRREKDRDDGITVGRREGRDVKVLNGGDVSCGLALGMGMGMGRERIGKYRFEEVGTRVIRCAVRDADAMGSLEKAFKPLEQRRHNILRCFGGQWLEHKREVDIRSCRSRMEI